jgi:hypothetical protein
MMANSFPHMRDEWNAIASFGLFYQPDIRQLADEKRLKLFPLGRLGR